MERMDVLITVRSFWIRLIVLGLSVFYLVSCQFTQSISIEPSAGPDSREMRLGESDYYVMLPESLRLSEARGKEGQLGYNLMPRDTASTQYGFIEIRRGSPILGGSTSTAKPVGSATSRLLDNRVTWTVDQTETGYFNAYTNEGGEVNARASSKDREELNNLIAIIATLKKK